ncbi:penicillin-binding protein 1A [Pedobacter sp. UYP30]|uniref:transglycosylase domain-containing protein n=1 Tax=Pedobacter sp. UYP30 TaxID=1756400 RepID=UPI00339B7E7D
MFKEIKNRYLRYFIILIYFIIIFFASLQLNFLGLFGYSPSRSDIKQPTQRVGSELYTADGKLIGRYYKENRTPVNYNEIPTSVINALVATEDVRFYKHWGIDFQAVGRAVIGLGQDGGASTITQQLAKNLYRTRYNKSQGLLAKIPVIRTVIFKFKEWMTAVKLEANYSKNDIITMYLNTVSFGNNTYGIKTASRIYFDREPKNLKIEESALLVGMLKGTTLYNPTKNPKNALNRRNVVFTQMNKYHYLSTDSMVMLKSEPITLNAGKLDDSSDGDSYLRAAVAKYLEKWCKDNGYDLYEDGLKIYTTIDSKLQKYAEEAVQDEMKILQRRFYNVWGKEDPWYDSEKKKVDFPDRAKKSLPIYNLLLKKFPNQPDSIDNYFNKKKRMQIFTYKGDRDTLFSTMDSIRYYGKILNTGMMTMEPSSGKIKVWVGGIDHKFFKYDHVNQAKRQAGSTFKPFAYLTALEQGMSPCDKMTDKPVRIEYQDKGVTKYWEPKNADWGNTYQDMSLRLAMARSVNSITAQLTEKVGWDNVVKWAHECGIDSHLESVPSVSLGSNDVNVYEMVKAYSTFMGKGVRTDPILVEKITDQDDKVIEDFVPKTKKVLSDEIAWLMTYMFRGGMEEPGGTSQALWEWPNLFKKNNQIGGKTGTSSDYVDAWYMGLTKDLVTGVWVGCDERTAHFKNGDQGEGSHTALPIFAKFMEKVYLDPNSGYTYGPFPKPTVPITRSYNCPSPRIVRDTATVDTTVVDSTSFEPPAVEDQQQQTPTETAQPVVKKEEPKNTPPKNTPPVTATQPLSNKEERELKRKQRQEERERRKKGNE